MEYQIWKITRKNMSNPNSPSKYWQQFWNNYLGRPPVTTDDLLQQVAKTVNKKPVPMEIIKCMIEMISKQLTLTPADCLLDFCCGNGLLDEHLSAHVGKLVGVDFAQNLIETAQKLKQHPNITYQFGDVISPLESLVGRDIKPNKYLMVDSLGYFQPAELDTILDNIKKHLAGKPFQFLLTGIPNYDLKWNYYDTPERAARHLDNEQRTANINDGIGRWWQAAEVMTICSKHGLFLRATNQPHCLSNYRMDVVISTTPLVEEKAIVYLRALNESDLERTHQWHNNTDLFEYLGGNFRFISKTAEAEWLRERVAFSRNSVNLAICLLPGGEHVGNIYLRDINWVSRNASMHLFIGSSEFRKKGYGYEAIRQLLAHAFLDLNLNRIHIEMLATNANAIKVYEKCGFVMEGRLKQHAFKQGKFVDVLVMGLTSDQYNSLGGKK